MRIRLSFSRIALIFGRQKIDMQSQTIMEYIEDMSIEELRACLKYCENAEYIPHFVYTSYEICAQIKDLIKIKERDIKLNELGI